MTFNTKINRGSEKLNGKSSLVKTLPKRFFSGVLYDELTVQKTVEIGRDLKLKHIFGENYDPETQAITPVHVGWENGKKKWAYVEQGKTGKDVRDRVENVLLLWNWQMYRPKHLEVDKEDFFKTSLQHNLEYHEPYVSELLALAILLAVKRVLDEHGIRCTILYLPSDLPQGSVKGLEGMRKMLKVNLSIEPNAQRVFQAYEFASLPVFTNKDVKEDLEGVKSAISSTSHLWWALEGQFRKDASKLLDYIISNCTRGVKPLVEMFLKKYRPELTMDDWNNMRKISKNVTQQWKFIDGLNGYYIHSKRGGYSFYVPIGAKIEDDNGNIVMRPPKCAMITVSIMETAAKLGFTHVFAAFNSKEVRVASGGLLLADSMLRIPVHPFVLSVDNDWLIPVVSGKGGVLGYRYPIFDWMR